MLATTPQIHRINLNEWHKMENIFMPDNHLQLINGEIIDMAPINCNHSGELNWLVNFFSQQLHGEAILSIQNPLQLHQFSEPEPDLMLLKPEKNFYRKHHPIADDVLLLIEISSSSLEFDRHQKRKLYATYNITEYWIINLKDYCIEIYRQPKNDNYTQKQILHADDNICLLNLPNTQSSSF